LWTATRATATALGGLARQVGLAAAARSRRAAGLYPSGHYDSSFTMKTYVRATDDLKQGRQALAKIHHIV
jgi:hypothetical protein